MYLTIPRLLAFADECARGKHLGAERQALEGCAKIIARDRPKMLLAAYHRSEDLFAIPLQIAAMRPDYRFYLRHYPYIPAWDTNLYCV